MKSKVYIVAVRLVNPLVSEKGTEALDFSPHQRQTLQIDRTIEGLKLFGPYREEKARKVFNHWKKKQSEGVFFLKTSRTKVKEVCKKEFCH